MIGCTYRFGNNTWWRRMLNTLARPASGGFEHAVHNARLIEAVRRAADRGERQRVTSEES
jgi:hypothetical protein